MELDSGAQPAERAGVAGQDRAAVQHQGGEAGRHGDGAAPARVDGIEAVVVAQRGADRDRDARLRRGALGDAEVAVDARDGERGGEAGVEPVAVHLVAEAAGVASGDQDVGDLGASDDEADVVLEVVDAAEGEVDRQVDRQLADVQQCPEVVVDELPARPAAGR